MYQRFGLLLTVALAATTAAAANGPTVLVDPDSNSFAAISVPNIDSSSAWYKEHFGLSATYSYTSDDKSLRILVLSRPGLSIELQQHSNAAPDKADRDKPFLSHGIFKFGVTVTDVRDAVSRLSKAGAEIRVEPFDDQGGKFTSAVVSDASGNLIQLFQFVHEQPVKHAE